MRQDGFTLLEMAVVLVMLSFLLLITTPSVRSISRLALLDFTEALVIDISEASQYPYVSADEKCVPRLRWYLKDRQYLITCGTTVLKTGVIPSGVQFSLPVKNEIVFSKTVASYAGQWKFQADQLSVTLKFRMGTYEPEVIRSDGK